MSYINLSPVSDYITFQYILNAACFSYMLSYIYTFTGRKWIYIVSVLYMGGFTPIVLQVMTTTKDGMFLPFFVLCMTLTIELNQMESKEAPVGKWILWSVSGVFMTIFRKNCILALPVLLICMYKNMPSQRKKVIVFSSLTVMFFMLYQMLFVPVFVSKKVDERELLSVFAQQMGRFYLDGETEITEEEKDMVEHLITREGLDSYQFRIADHAKGWMDMDYYHAHKKELWQTYFSLMMRNPGIAMMSFMELNSGLWYPGCELTLYPDGRKAYWIVQCFEPAEMQSRIPTLLAYYKLFESSECATRNSFTAVLFAPATYFYLFLFFYMYSVNAEKKNFRPFFRFVLVYWGWYLFGPVALVRYVSFLFAIVPLYVLVIAQRKGDRA